MQSIRSAENQRSSSQVEMSACQKSQRMRLSHLNKVAQMIGIDGLAVCGNQADISFFEEYNFEGLINEPWYDLMNGKEMRSLFKKSSRSKNQHHARKMSHHQNHDDQNSLEVTSSHA